MNFKLNISLFSRIVIYSLVVFGVMMISQDVTLATTNISQDGSCGGAGTKCQWAWNDEMGWINLYSSNSVTVGSSKITGYGNFCGSTTPCNNPPANYFSFDCETSPYPGTNICAGSGNSPEIEYKVFNDGLGNLSGWAWSDAIGWISFCGGYSGCNSSPINYRVSINTATGDFSGWAWNDKVGWISFNCADGGTCGTVDYKVRTSWSGGAPGAMGNITSVTYDTTYASGVNYNSIMWKGSLNGGSGTVEFQLATSNCSNGADDPNNEDGVGAACDHGSWSFKGPDGTSGTTYIATESRPVPIVGSYHVNHQYYRYKLFLRRNSGESAPTVTDVVVNWSP